MNYQLLVPALLAVLPVHAEQTCNTDTHPLSTPTERFDDNGDGTVTDTVSGLMWMRCAEGQRWDGQTCEGTPEPYSWNTAHSVAESVNAGGAYFFNDWRLPKLRELALIAERECENPRINLDVFPSTPAAFFWTSSTRPAEGFEDYAYALSFGPDGVQHRSKEDSYYVRLVRIAQ
jgi:hypothetical protein